MSQLNAPCVQEVSQVSPGVPCRVTGETLGICGSFTIGRKREVPSNNSPSGYNFIKSIGNFFVSTLPNFSIFRNLIKVQNDYIRSYYILENNPSHLFKCALNFKLNGLTSAKPS